MKEAILLDPFSGASGDMLLASLVSAGVGFDRLREALYAVPELSQVSVDLQPVKRGILDAVRLEVSYPEEQESRSLAEIISIVEKANLSEPAKLGAIDTFTRLAAAEAKVHGCGVEEIHFHEVGALDAILDIIGWHIALDLLGTPACYYNKIVLGSGSTRCSHGEIPVPSPATIELLRGHRVVFSGRQEELVTPTAAAVIASSCRPLPDGVMFIPERIGYGAGSREGVGVLPNVLRTIVGSIEERKPTVCVITSTIDDMNPELYGFLMDKLLEMGALDVYFNAVMMKKNRPGLEITVITEEQSLNEIASFILTHTTTLGLRINREERLELRRRQEEVDTPYGKVKVKVAELPGGGKKMSPEYESCREVAEKTGARILEVFEATRLAWDKTRS